MAKCMDKQGVVLLVTFVIFSIFLLFQFLNLKDLLVHEDIYGTVIKKTSGSRRFLSTYDLKVRYPYKEKDKEYIISIEANNMGGKGWRQHESGGKCEPN